MALKVRVVEELVMHLFFIQVTGVHFLAQTGNYYNSFQVQNVQKTAVSMVTSGASAFIKVFLKT